MALTNHTVAYSDEGSSLTGLFCHDETVRGQLPGILLIHGGAGLDDHAREQSQRWAALGYAVFACDMYGQGVTGDREQITETLAVFQQDAAALARRARAGLDVLRNSPDTDGRFAVVGFCFGGMAALTLARAGDDLTASVSMHGSLKTPSPAQPDTIRAEILVCHGAADPFVPLDDVTVFAQEMEQARAHWQLTMYGGALHGFTHRHMQPGTMRGVAYDERADRQSFADAARFVAEATEDAGDR